MNTKGPKKKKQHYVPKFYLRGFCGSGDTVFALDKESGGIFTPSVGDFCAERYLYESLSNDPNWYKGKFVYPNYTEDGLCELESAFAPVLKRVAALCVPNAPFTCVGDDDARIIASFVANAIARHPSVFKPLRNELMLSASEEDLSPYRDLMRALGHEGAFEGVAAEGVTRRLLLDTGDGSYQGLIVGELLEMEGIVLRAPGCASFATASFPVLPVVRETGGLKDTVHYFDKETKEGNGFSFATYNAHDMLFTLQRAVGLYYDEPELWKTLMTNASKSNFDWKISAETYLYYYKKVTGKLS